MKKVIIASLLGAALVSMPFVFSSANAISSDTDKCNKGSVSVSYTAEKEVAPDTVEVSIAVKTSDKTSMQTAVKKNKEISDKVYDYLKTFISLGNGDYIKTANYSASPEYSYNSGKRTLTGYNVSNNIIVHTKYVDKISTAIDKSISLGATNIDSLNFSLSNKDKVCSDLLATATKQTRQRADIVAAAAGSAVTGIKGIDTSCSLNNTSRPIYYRNSLMSAKSAMTEDAAGVADNGVNIESGVIKVYSSVNASYYLK